MMESFIQGNITSNPVNMRQNFVAAGLVLGLAGVTGAAPAPAVCSTTTYAASVPTNTAVAVELQAFAYCNGSVYAAAYIEVSVVEGLRMKVYANYDCRM
jgi:hypothetical protein